MRIWASVVSPPLPQVPVSQAQRPALVRRPWLSSGNGASLRDPPWCSLSAAALWRSSRGLPEPDFVKQLIRMIRSAS